MNEEQEAKMKELLLELPIVDEVIISRYKIFILVEIMLKGSLISKESLERILDIISLYEFIGYSIVYDMRTHRLVVLVNNA